MVSFCLFSARFWYFLGKWNLTQHLARECYSVTEEQKQWAALWRRSTVATSHSHVNFCTGQSNIDIADKIKIKEAEVISLYRVFKFSFCFVFFLRLSRKQIRLHGHVSLSVTNCSNYPDKARRWHHYDDVIMSPAHLTGSNRKVPKDISVMNERTSLRIAFLSYSAITLDLNKPSF